MAIFKSKKKEDTEKKEEVVQVDKKEKASTKREPLAWKALKSPYISEKATNLASEDKYIFVAKDKSNKKEIKDAVEELYKVNVLNVNIIKTPKKKKRLGRHHGWRKGFKKAVVQIKEGQKIDIYPS